MITVVIIASDQRAVMLKEHFQPLVKAQITVDSDYEHGLKAVFDKRPALVFIQGEIGGVSGGAVAKQIKALLRDSAPCIVLMGDAATLKEKARSWYDDSLNFSADEDDLLAQFRAQLGKHLPDLWKDEAGPSKDLAGLQVGSKWDTVEPVATPVAGRAPVTPRATGGAPRPRDVPPLSPPANDVPRVVPPAEKPQPSPSVAISPESRVAASIPAPTKPTPRPPGGGRPIAKPAAPKVEFPPFESRFPEGVSARRNPWLYISGLAAALVLAALITYFTSSGRFMPKTGSAVPPAKSQATPTPAVSPARARIARLPDIVPVSGKDPGYESKHPGWSRYVGNGMEFKVFSAGGEIKAIQLIASGKGAIPGDMPDTLLGKLFGSVSYSLSSSSEKQGYLVQGAKLPGEAEMLIYRKKSTSEIRGIVVTVP